MDEAVMHPAASSEYMTSSQQPVRRAPRSKDGCLTCKRRKVRCNEQKPRCLHCERLNLECKWRSPVPSLSRSTTAQTAHSTRGIQQVFENTATNPRMQCATQSMQTNTVVGGEGSFNDVFDYANFMWNFSDTQSARSPPFEMSSVSDMTTQIQPSNTEYLKQGGTQPYGTAPVQSHFEDMAMLNDTDSVDDTSAEDRLLHKLITSKVPPILSQIEIQKNWASELQNLVAMADDCIVLRHAELTFADQLFRRRGVHLMENTTYYYDKAVAGLAEISAKYSCQDSDLEPNIDRVQLLATIFFLSYVEILRGMIESASSNLNKAYHIFQQADKNTLRGVEVRLLSWIRVLDARAVSAGGEGLFLSEDHESLLVTISPSPSSSAPTIEINTGLHMSEIDTEDLLFDILYRPGLIFFQKIQSFMGRISKIDQWHRSRGTVEDETEVMSIAAKISRDLKVLYEDRPALMDVAAAGRLTSAHLAENLAFTVTRTFRTYLCNYYASKIHLHRVAYRTLPLSQDTLEAVSAIKRMTKQMLEATANGTVSVPVNMLWPLLMWGCEETDQGERKWMLKQIDSMEATNARVTARVLEEVHTRQDAMSQRVDVRRVMHDIFDSSFAII